MPIILLFLCGSLCGIVAWLSGCHGDCGLQGLRYVTVLRKRLATPGSSYIAFIAYSTESLEASSSWAVLLIL